MSNFDSLRAIVAVLRRSNPSPGSAKRLWIFINPGRLPYLHVRALLGRRGAFWLPYRFENPFKGNRSGTEAF